MILLPDIKYHEQIMFFITFGLVLRGVLTSNNNKSVNKQLLFINFIQISF